ncbi:MAG: hypothetical protein DRP25_04960 [Thermotoga sp.]|nr:MAG: hypothetical protein DRP25_04960 [Thermotoga sp.]
MGTSWVKLADLEITNEEIEEVRRLYKKAGVEKQPHTLKLITAVKKILEEYDRQYHIKLTVRQLYYQLVTRGVIENSPKAYKNFDDHLSQARALGIIDWRYFEDRGRTFERPRKPLVDITKITPQEEIKSKLEYVTSFREHHYGIPKWYRQPNYVEVWVEKDALAGFLSKVTGEELGVPLVVSRGYTSVTFKFEARERFERARAEGKTPYLLYFGDLDPSGENICEVLEKELGDIAIVKRVALLPHHVYEYDLPPCPVKRTDSRAKRYIRKHRTFDAWELDALPPLVLIELVRESVQKLFNTRIYEQNLRYQRYWLAEYSKLLETIRKHTTSLEGYLDSDNPDESG